MATDAQIAAVDYKHDEADALKADKDAAKAPRAWPIVNRAATVQELDAAEHFLGTVARTATDGPCFTHLSILLGDALSRRAAPT